jgi:hypothetical protein
MNLATIIVLVFVVVAAVAAVAFMVHRRKRAGSEICCGCALRNYCRK